MGFASDGAVPIIDAHQHFWAARMGANEFLPADYLATIATAKVHVAATVFAECLTHYDRQLPTDLQSTGETRFAAGIGERYAEAPVRLAAAIIAYADPLEALRPFATVVDAHGAVAQGRLRAFRRSVAWDEDETLNYASLKTRPAMLAQSPMRDAARVLAERGLIFETWLYHPQIAELADFALAVPECTIMLDHAGTPLGSGRHRDTDAFPAWREAMARLAERPNVHVKIGGLVTPGTALDARRLERGLTSWTGEALAEELSPWIMHLLDCFGAERCVFESNFPVDAGRCEFGVLIDAYLDMLSAVPRHARDAVLSGNAARLYAIDLSGAVDAGSGICRAS